MDQWFVDNQPLRSLAFDVQAVVEGHGIPPARGSNIVVPFRQGTKRFTKYYNERRLTLAMFVVGADPDGGVPTNPDAMSLLYANLDTLRQTFGKRSAELSLKRVLPDGTIRTASAEIMGTMDFADVKGASARFVVDLQMADPFWYGPQQTSRVWFGTPVYGMDAVYTGLSWYYGEGHLYGTVWTSPQSWTINHPGTFETSKLEIRIEGACQNPRVTHSDGTYVEILETMVAGQVLVIDGDAFTATLDGASVIGSLRHSGDPSFLKLFPGDNVLSLRSDATPAAAMSILFDPLYL